MSENLFRLAGSTYAFIFPEYEDLGNAGVVATDEGVVVIDTDVRSVDPLFAALPRITDKPVKFLINSHHAFDHSSANCRFAEKGVTIIGSKACREEMIRHGEVNFERWSKRVPPIGELLKERKITVALPHLTFDHELTLHLGGETVELYHFGHAHTAGDIVVYLPRQEILFAGDLLWCSFFPNVREADVPNQIKVVDRILEFPVRYYVPGHGPVTSDRNEIVQMRDHLSALWEGVERVVREGGAEEQAHALRDRLIERHPTWRGRQFVTTAVEVLMAARAK